MPDVISKGLEDESGSDCMDGHKRAGQVGSRAYRRKIHIAQHRGTAIIAVLQHRKPK